MGPRVKEMQVGSETENMQKFPFVGVVSLLLIFMH